MQLRQLPAIVAAPLVRPLVRNSHRIARLNAAGGVREARRRRREREDVEAFLQGTTTDPALERKRP